MRPKGLVTISRITLASGQELPLQKAVDYGWITPSRSPKGWGVGRDEISLGENLFLDQGRQLAAFCLGFRSPISDYVISKFGVGTGLTAPKVSDVTLEAPVTLSGGSTLKAIDSIDFLTAYVIRVAYTLGLSDANGNLLTERGLFSGNGTLLARHVTSIGIQKTSDWSPTLVWRIRT